MSEKEFPFKRAKPVDGFKLRRKEENAPQSEGHTPSLKKSKPKRKSASAEVTPEVAEKLKRLENYLLARNRTEGTLEQYIRVAVKFLSVPDSFTREGVDGFLADLHRRGLGNESIRWHHYVLKTLFKCWGIVFPIEEDEAPRGDIPRPPIFSEEQMTAMEEVAAQMGKREHAMVRLSNAIGIRRGEIRNINIGDYVAPRIMIRTLKGGYEVQRLLDPRTCEVLDEYLKEHVAVTGKADREAFFVRGRRGPRLSLRGVNLVYARVRDRAQIEEGGLHAARRGRITGLVRAGMPTPEIVKEWGWRKSDTVNTYVRLTKQDAEKKLVIMHPYFVDAKKPYDRAEAVKDESDSTGAQSAKPSEPKTT